MSVRAMEAEMAPPRGPVGRACSLAGWGFLQGLSATHRRLPPWAQARAAGEGVGVGGQKRRGNFHHETAGIQTGPDQEESLALVTGSLEDNLRIFSLGVTSRKSPTAYNYLSFSTPHPCLNLSAAQGLCAPPGDASLAGTAQACSELGTFY